MIGLNIRCENMVFLYPTTDNLPLTLREIFHPFLNKLIFRKKFFTPGLFPDKSVGFSNRLKVADKSKVYCGSRTIIKVGSVFFCQVFLNFVHPVTIFVVAV